MIRTKQWQNNRVILGLGIAKAVKGDNWVLNRPLCSLLSSARGSKPVLHILYSKFWLLFSPCLLWLVFLLSKERGRDPRNGEKGKIVTKKGEEGVTSVKRAACGGGLPEGGQRVERGKSGEEIPQDQAGLAAGGESKVVMTQTISLPEDQIHLITHLPTKSEIWKF